MKKYIVIAALLTSTAILAQQQDSLLRRQMELEREFNPTLQDANKINSLPSAPQPTVQKANTAYSAWAGRTTPPLEIAVPKPTDIMTDIPYSLKKGYISLGAGNYANIDGALGYRFIDDAKQTLGFRFLHNSANGDVTYVQDGNPASNKAFFMDNAGGVSYARLFDAFKLNLSGGYAHSMFNYYGNTFGDVRTFKNETQAVGVFNLRAGAKSVASDWLNYGGYVEYKNFNAAYSPAVGNSLLKGNQIDAFADFNKPFSDGNPRVGVSGNFLGVFYGLENAPAGTTMDNFLMLNAAPYIAFEGFNWNARLGADILFQFAQNNKVRVAPNVELGFRVTEKSSLYANIKGRIDENTFLNMMSESRYIAPMTETKPSFSLVDIEVGAKIGEMSGFRFDIFGGFKKTEDEHFLMLENKYQHVQIPPDILFVKEFLTPVYGTASHSHIGGMIQTNIWSPLDISLRLKKNFYTVSDLTIHAAQISEAKAYNRPGFDIDLRATFEAMSNLKFTLNYYFAGDRWSYFNNANVKMTNINDLNLGAVYDINNSFAINLKVNNLLFQKQDIWYGHPAQGFNAMGGFTFKF